MKNSSSSNDNSGIIKQNSELFKIPEFTFVYEIRDRSVLQKGFAITHSIIPFDALRCLHRIRNQHLDLFNPSRSIAPPF